MAERTFGTPVTVTSRQPLRTAPNIALTHGDDRFAADVRADSANLSGQIPGRLVVGGFPPLAARVGASAVLSVEGFPGEAGVEGAQG